MATSTHRITYRGGPVFASMLVQMLEEEGVATQWKRPEEQRGGLGDMAQEVVVQIVAGGSLLAITAAVKKFRELTRGRADVTVEDEDDSGEKEAGTE